MTRRILAAASLLACSCAATPGAAPAADANLPLATASTPAQATIGADGLTLSAPRRQHLAGALRLVVGGSTASTVYVRAELPTILYAGRPAYFKTQVVLDDSGTLQRLRLQMPTAMRRFVQRRLPAWGVVVYPSASVRGGSAPARANAIRLLP